MKTEFEYPMWFKGRISCKVIKFNGLCSGTVIVNDRFSKVGDYSTTWCAHTNDVVWEDVTDQYKFEEARPFSVDEIEKAFINPNDEKITYVKIKLGSKFTKDGEVVEVKYLGSHCDEYGIIPKCVYFVDSNGDTSFMSESLFLEQYKPYFVEKEEPHDDIVDLHDNLMGMSQSCWFDYIKLYKDDEKYPFMKTPYTKEDAEKHRRELFKDLSARAFLNNIKVKSELKSSRAEDIIESQSMNYNQGRIFKIASSFNGKKDNQAYKLNLENIIYFARRELSRINKETK